MIYKIEMFKCLNRNASIKKISVNNFVATPQITAVCTVTWEKDDQIKQRIQSRTSYVSGGWMVLGWVTVCGRVNHLGM